MMRKRISGFTIVELLIVIVIIGILSAIVIVVYNGLQVRSDDAKRAAGMAQYAKLIEMHYSELGELPRGYNVDDSGYVCMGTKEQYPATGNWPAGACAISQLDGVTFTATTSVSDEFVEDLSKYSSSLPNVSYADIVDLSGGDGSVLVRGPWYVNTGHNQAQMLYYAKYSGTSGGKGCLWGGQFVQMPSIGMEYCHAVIDRYQYYTGP